MKLSTLRKWSASLLLLFASCGREPLAIDSEYLLPNRFASVYVSTPDPRKDFPSVGQRLYIKWHLRRQMLQYKEITLKLAIRFRNYRCKTIEMPILFPVGSANFCLMDNEFFETGGISAYRGELWADGELIATRCHALWQEVIEIPPEDLQGDYGEPNLLPDDVDYQNPLPQQGNDFYKL